jgi:hypothetical protein
MVLVARRFGDAEIHQLERPAPGHHHVGRLDVPMDHAPLVRVVQRRQHLPHVIHRFAHRQAPLLEPLFQRDSLQILHQHQELVLHPHGGVERRDVGVLQACLHFDLAHEAVGQFGRGGKVREEHFHRLDAI